MNAEDKMARADKIDGIFGIKNTFLEVRSSAIERDTCDDVLEIPPHRQHTDPTPSSRSYSDAFPDARQTSASQASTDEPHAAMPMMCTRQFTASQSSTDEPHAPVPMMGRSDGSLEENESDGRAIHECKDVPGAESFRASSSPYDRQVTPEQYWPAWSESMPAVSNQQMFSPDSWCVSVPVMLQAPVAPDEWGSYTTVMMRNLPNKYTQHMLLEKLHDLGFAGTFDFLYLPIDRETNANKGYCFINFSEPYYAWMLKTTCEGQKMGKFNSSKEVSVVPASLQGFEANYAHYSNTNVNRGDPTARPLFLREPDVSEHRKARHGGGSRKSQANATKQQQMSPDSHSSGFSASPSAGKGSSLVRKVREDMQASFQNVQSTTDASRIPRFCPFCGTKREENFNFCSSCGQSFVQS